MAEERRGQRTPKPGDIAGTLCPERQRPEIGQRAEGSAIGNAEEASRAIHHCLSQLPHLNLDNISPGFVPRYVRDDHHARFLDMLARAGLPRA